MNQFIEFQFVNTNLCNQHKERIGPFICKYLTGRPNEIVVTGSVLYNDGLYSHDFGRDVNVVCISQVGKQIVLDALHQGMYVSRSEHNMYTRVDLFTIFTGHFSRVYILVCESPFQTISEFAMSHDRIAFDGVTYYHCAPDYHQTTLTNIDQATIDEISNDLLGEMNKQKEAGMIQCYLLDHIVWMLTHAIQFRSERSCTVNGFTADFIAKYPMKLLFHLKQLTTAIRLKYTVMNMENQIITVNPVIVAVFSVIPVDGLIRNVMDIEKAEALYEQPLPDLSTLQL